MPDLSKQAVNDWLTAQGHVGASIGAPMFLPEEESPSVEAALIRLGQALESAFERSPSALSEALRGPVYRERLTGILAQLGTGRILCVMDWLVRRRLPHSDAVFGALLEPDEAGNGQFLQSVLANQARRDLLERLFSPERLALLLSAVRATPKTAEAA